MNNKVITTQGNVQFQFPDGKIVNVHPNHIYTVFNEDTVSFILVGLPKTSGLSTMTSKAEDLELNGTVYSFAELPNAVSEAFAIAGAQARCEIVDELPETGYTNTIYLVPQPAPQTGFDEYVYILDQGWELIGDTSIEMDNYVLKTVFSGYTADTAVVLNGLRTDVDTTSGNVITETERALLAESGLSDAIDAEETAREAADGVISGAVDTVSSGLTEEVQRAQNAESGLSDAIDAEETAREAADGVISGAVDTVSSGLTEEAQRAQNAESGLSDAIDVVSGNVETEEARAISAETALDNKIDAISGAVDTKLAISDFNTYSAATDAALANKQNTLIAGENITISSTTSGDVISAEGSTITIDPTLDSGSTNAVANSAVSAALNYNDMFLYRVNPVKTWDGHPTGILQLRWRNPYNGFTGTTQDAITLMKINNIPLIEDYVSGISNLNLVETSAITTSVTSASTDSQVPSAKAMYDELAAIDVKFIDDAKYELSGSTHVINFYNGDVVKATIDASDFIVDGMVDNVYIENGYLVIDFNTESGKQDIQIPLTDIFNPNNYYTKSETSGATELSTEFATKLNTADFNTYSAATDSRLSEDEEVTSRALNALNETVSGKADSDDVYLKSETSGATEIATALSAKLDATAYTPTDLSNYYQKNETSGATEISTALSNKLDATAYTPTDLSNYYTKSETSGATELSTAFAATQPKLSAGTGISIDANNVISAEGGSDINVVQTTGTSTADVMSQSAVTTQLDNKANSTDAVGGYQFGTYSNVENIKFKAVGTGYIGSTIYYPNINGKGILTNNLTWAKNNYDFQLVETSAITTSVTSASTDSQIPSAKAVYDAIQEGGGKAIEAGRGISVTSGETADTVSISLPISAGTGEDSVVFGKDYGSDMFLSAYTPHASSMNSFAFGSASVSISNNSFATGYLTKVKGGTGTNGNFAQGYMTTASGNRCHAEGLGTTSSADASHSEGYKTTASGNYSHSEGEEVNATNTAEHSQGRFNVSNKANTTFGDSGNTLFSVGNGTADNARHNAFEIRQNGDIYCSDGTNDVKLQDTITATAANTTALGGMKIVKLTESEYAALVTKDSNTLYVVIPDPTNP